MTKSHEALPILLWVLACGGVLSGCGGSASETPPPLEPSTNPRAPYVQKEQPSKSPAAQSKRIGDPNAESTDPDAASEGAPEGEPPPDPADPE